MAGSGGEEPEPPAVEIVMTDGERVSASPPRPGGRIGTSARLGIVVAAVALFAFGVIVGRGTITSRFGTALPAPVTTSASPSTSTTRSTASAIPSATPGATSTWAPTPADSFEAAVDAAAWPATPGACGDETPKPIVDGARPLTDTVRAQILAGGSPARVDLATGTVSGPLFAPEASGFITSLAADSTATLAVIAPCDGTGPWQIVNAANDGTTSTLTLPEEQIRPQLVGGGDRVWTALPSPGAYGYSPIPLVAADGSSDTITLPQGLVPMAGRGGTIVGQWYDGSAPSGLFGVVDAQTGELFQQFGDRTVTDDRTVVNATSDGDYLVAAPWACADTCPVRRYNLATGEEHSAELEPASDHILAGGAAISPDGSTAAVALYDQQPSPAPFDPDPAPSTRPSGTVRIGLIDLNDGTVRALPGITLGPSQAPALAFTPDGAWLIVAMGDGDATRLLLYTAGGDGPYDPHLTVPGPVLWPLVAVAPQPAGSR